MAVRVRLWAACGGRSLDLVALVNSGFEADTPQPLLPAPAARQLGLWPPLEAREETYDTAGGPARVWVYPGRLRVKVQAESPRAAEVQADVVVSPIEEEALISDLLAGLLGIAVEDFGRGLWRLRGEGELRETERPQAWR